MKEKTRIEIEKEEAIDIAIELCYGKLTIEKIERAKTVHEIDRILKQARLDKD